MNPILGNYLEEYLPLDLMLSFDSNLSQGLARVIEGFDKNTRLNEQNWFKRTIIGVIVEIKFYFGY